MCSHRQRPLTKLQIANHYTSRSDCRKKRVCRSKKRRRQTQRTIVLRSFPAALDSSSDGPTRITPRHLILTVSHKGPDYASFVNLNLWYIRVSAEGAESAEQENGGHK